MLSLSSQYAIRALSILTIYPRDEYVSTKTLATQADLTVPYLAKILQHLALEKILESRKGPKGGFRFACDCEQISLYEVVDIIENLEHIPTCWFCQFQKRSERRPCFLHDFWSKQSGRYRITLQKTTLEDLKNYKRRPRSSSTTFKKVEENAKSWIQAS